MSSSYLNSFSRTFPAEFKGLDLSFTVGKLCFQSVGAAIDVRVKRWAHFRRRCSGWGALGSEERVVDAFLGRAGFPVLELLETLHAQHIADRRCSALGHVKEPIWRKRRSWLEEKTTRLDEKTSSPAARVTTKLLEHFHLDCLAHLPVQLAVSMCSDHWRRRARWTLLRGGGWLVTRPLIFNSGELNRCVSVGGTSVSVPQMIVWRNRIALNVCVKVVNPFGDTCCTSLAHSLKESMLTVSHLFEGLLSHNLYGSCSATVLVSVRFTRWHGRHVSTKL
jgi:hypothetical protein